MAKANNFDFYFNPYYPADKSKGYLVAPGDIVTVLFGQKKEKLDGEVIEVFSKRLVVKTKYGTMSYGYKLIKDVWINQERAPDLTAKQLRERLRKIKLGVR